MEEETYADTADIKEKSFWAFGMRHGLGFQGRISGSFTLRDVCDSSNAGTVGHFTVGSKVSIVRDLVEAVTDAEVFRWNDHHQLLSLT